MELKVSRTESTKSKAKTVSEKVKKPKKPKKDPNATILALLEQVRLDIEENLGQYKERYYVINTVDELTAYIDAANAFGKIAIDTETLGKDPMKHNIVGFSLYSPLLDGVYIPLNHIDFRTGEKVPGQLSVEDARECLSKIMARIIMFNAGFDKRVLSRWVGVDLPCYWDCSLAAHLLNENEPSFKLKDLHAKYILENGKKGKSFGDFFKKITFDKIPIELGYLYAANDPVITYELYELQNKYLSANGPKGLAETYHLFMDTEMPCVEVVAAMEDYGIALNTELLDNTLIPEFDRLFEEAKQECEQAVLELKPKLDAYVAEHPGCGLTDPVNPNSTKQLQVILYDILGMRSTDKKAPKGTSVNIIQGFNLPITNAVLNLRKVQKLRNTYIRKMPREAINGRVHCRFNQMGAACITGDSLIPTEDGYRTIAEMVGDIPSGDMREKTYRIVNMNKTIETSSHVVKYIRRPTIKAQLGYGITIEGTYNHPIINNTTDPSEDGFYAQRKFVELQDLRRGDYVEIPLGYNVFSEEYQYIGNMGILTEEIAETLGYNQSMHTLLLVSPCSVIQAFIRGLATHGTTALEDRLSIPSIDKNTATFVQQALFNMGCVSILTVTRDSRYYIQVLAEDYTTFANLIGLNQDLFKERTAHRGSSHYICGGSLWVKVERIGVSLNDVYDLHVPNTHSFISNGLISHNTGRFSSSNPNLQNIPAKNTLIRQMFSASTREYEIELDNNTRTFVLEKSFEVETPNGYTFAERLCVGDILITDEGNVTVKSISCEEGLLGKVYIEIE